MSADVGMQEIYEKIMSSINEIDEKLDSRTDGKALGKRTLVNDLIELTKTHHESVVAQFVEQLNAVSPDEMVGIYYGITRGLDKAFRESASKYVDQKVETMPKPEPLISEEEVKPLSAMRSELYQKAKAVIDLVKTFDDSIDWEMPKKRTGSRGKRGARATSFITWTVDGKDYKSLKDLAEAYPQFEKVTDLRKFIAEKGYTPDAEKPGIDLKTPPAEFFVDMPDGNTAKAVYAPPAEGTVTDTEEDDDDPYDESDDPEFQV